MKYKKIILSLTVIFVVFAYGTYHWINPYERVVHSNESASHQISIVAASKIFIADTIIQLRVFDKSRKLETFRTNILNIDTYHDINTIAPIESSFVNNNEVHIKIGEYERKVDFSPSWLDDVKTNTSQPE